MPKTIASLTMSTTTNEPTTKPTTMKNLKAPYWRILILFVFFYCGTAAAQDSTITFLLPGNWAVDYSETKKKMHPEGRRYLDEMPQERRDRQETSYALRQYVFTQDGGFSIALHDGQTVNGNWMFLPENNILELTLANGQRQQYQILYIDNTKLGLYINVPDQEKLLYPELHLLKQN